MKSINIFSIDLPVRRSFQWRVLFALVILYFLGNLAGIPLLRKTGVPIEPVLFWGIATLISAMIISLSMAMANRVGLGVPFLEGRISNKDFLPYLRSGLALTMLMLVIGFPLSLIANLNADPATYPLGWELLAASFKAGVVEEAGYRFFMVSLFVWIGRFFKHDDEGRPNRVVYWIAVLLASLIFGWAHVDARLGHPTATFFDYVLIMVLNSAVGFYFGWVFWKLGLEWAMIVHFAYDAFASMILIPVYLLRSPIVWAIFLSGIFLASMVAWRMLWRVRQS